VDGEGTETEFMSEAKERAVKGKLQEDTFRNSGGIAEIL
jgi:hypothetical protein